MICGVDEAGRGPVIGPLVIAGVLASEEDFEALQDMGVRDSKRLTKNTRERLYGEITKKYRHYTIHVSPREIDRLMKKMTLNKIEAEKFAEVINKLKPETAYIDAADAVPGNFKKAIEETLKQPTTLIIEHKADEIYPIVSAASIVAKVERDRVIEKLSRKYGNIGSGYPSDPKTKEFLKRWYQKNQSFPEIVRESWKTIDVFKNRRITDF